MHNQKRYDRIIIHCVNGYIRHSNRITQLHRVCEKLNIQPRNIVQIDISNAWFTGFFDADGTVTLNTSKPYPQITISVTNKRLVDVQPFINCFWRFFIFWYCTKWILQMSSTESKRYSNDVKLFPSMSFSKL